MLHEGNTRCEGEYFTKVLRTKVFDESYIVQVELNYEIFSKNLSEGIFLKESYEISGSSQRVVWVTTAKP